MISDSSAAGTQNSPENHFSAAISGGWGSPPPRSGCTAFAGGGPGRLSATSKRRSAAGLIGRAPSGTPQHDVTGD